MRTRENDFVRIVKPEFVRRVGYPKEPADYLRDVEAEHGAAVRKLLGLEARGMYQRWLKDLAYLRCQRESFGGRERTLHTTLIPEMARQERLVERTRHVVTGTYCTAYQSFDGEWNPAELINRKTWTLLSVGRHGFRNGNTTRYGTLWILSENVEKLPVTGR